MKRLNLSPNETVSYAYDPEADELTIQLQDGRARTTDEPLPGAPHVTLHRERQSGDVVRVTVQEVQDFILQNVVRAIVDQVQQAVISPSVEAAPAPPEPSGRPRQKPPRQRSRAQKREKKRAETEPPPRSQPAAEGPVPEPPDEPPAEARGDAAASEPSRRKRRRRGKKKRADSTAPQPTAEAPPILEETPEQPKRKRRRRRRKRSRDEAPQQAEADEAPERAEEPPARGRHKHGGRRRGRDREETPTGADADFLSISSYKTSPIAGLDTPEGFRFLEMDPLLGQAIAAMGFEKPTPIQRRAVPLAMQGRDVIGLAQTGTGKTLAFLIPAFHRLVTDKRAGRQKNHTTRVLILTPTRELANQVAEEGEYLATHTDLRITTIYGGVGYGQQIRDLKAGADVIVATPGRLLDHMNRRNVRLDEVDVLVLDEADRMLDMGFLPEIRTIVRQVPQERQTFLFSATMPPPIESLSLDFQQNPELVEVARQLPPENIDQRLYPVERHLKIPLLVHMLEHDEAMRSVLVFTETKSEADVVTRKLREAQVNVTVMHGDRRQRDREQALESLRTGRVRVLVATNVAARGLDLPIVSHVINYDVPQTVDEYVHRIGRTARGDEAEGHAYTFVTSGDAGMIMRLEGALERELPRSYVESFDYDVPTPSWAKPAASDILDSLHKPKGLAERFSRMMRRR